jgi:hypothetical protein
MPYFIPQAPCTITESHTHSTSPQTHTTTLQTPVVTEQSVVIPPKTVCVSKDNIKEAIKGVKILISRVLFTKHAMTQNQTKCVNQFKDTIKDSIPHCLEADSEFFLSNLSYHYIDYS